VEIIDYSAWKPEKRPTLYNLSIKSLLNDFRRIRKYENFFRNDYTFSEKKLISSDYKKSIDFIKRQGYDAIFVGSDTLLELRGATNDELNAYWLDETVDSVKFLIAASSHNLVYENLSEEQKKKAQRTLNDYSLLGVRDEATFRLLSHFILPGDQRLGIVPDPTFTYKIDYNHIEKYLNRKRVSFRKPVVCLHLLRGLKWAGELADLFRNDGYLVASLRPAYYADIIFNDLSAFEQLGLYRYFDLVITHRFHDSIFSLKNLTPVIVFPEHVSDVTSFGENKNRTLFKSFGIENNYIGNRADLNALSIFNLHRQAINGFRMKKDHISATLSQNKKGYENFLERSASILEGKTSNVRSADGIPALP
jgi:hypothetical protein